MPRKLLIQLFACLVAVTVWGAGLPLVYAASTSGGEGASTVYVSGETRADGRAVSGPASYPETDYSAENWMLAFRPTFAAVGVGLETAIAVAPDVRPPTVDRPVPAAAPDAVKANPDPTPRAKPQATSKPKPESTPKPAADPTARPTPNQKPDPTPRPDPTPEPKPDPTPKPASSDSYSGASRFWYPALDISARWRWYGCKYGGDQSGLGAGVYRWGCVGGKNVYLMSHAWSTFSAIRRGYHSGRMQVGQTVYYSDPQGDVSRWRVKWIKRVDTDYFMRTFNEWASVSSSTPMITLQTCDGSNNQYRIIVRMAPA